MRFIAWSIVIVCVAACSRTPHEAKPSGLSGPSPAATSGAVVKLANPASENCIARGGRHSVAKLPAGDEYGVCLFEDNRQCEEWAMLRGHCRVGGRRITGYAAQAARYCAITGNDYAVTHDSPGVEERGTCTLRNGHVCEANAYYRGECR